MSRVASLFLKLTSSPEVAGEQRFLGEAKDALYKDQIEIDGWTWDLSRSSQSKDLTKIGSRIPPPPNSVEPSPLRFTKTMCRATAGMLGAMRDGALLKAVFSLEEDSSVDFLLTLTVDRARITGYELEIDGREVSESWVLNYETIRFDYKYNYAQNAQNVRRGAVTTTLNRPPDAPKRAPNGPSNGSKADEITKLAEDMDPKELRPLLQRLEKTLTKSSLTPPSAAKAGTKPTKDVKK